MKEITFLIDFIKENKNWKELLKKPPYSLKSITQCSYNPQWYMFVYNLFKSDLSLPLVHACRGTVLEIKEGPNEKNIREVNVICLPYYKFFNHGDPLAHEVEWNSSRVMDKMDGTLIKMSRWNNSSYWFTNGSFDLMTPLEHEDKSLHISNYKELLAYALNLGEKCIECSGMGDGERFIWEGAWTSHIPNGWTLMFELCSPLKPIQVHYPHTHLWFHGARDPQGNEHIPEEVKEMFSIPYDIPKTWNLHSLKDTLDMLHTFKEDKEGFVVVDRNFNRIKMKSDVYLKMKFTSEDTSESKLFHLVVSDGYDDILPIIPQIRPKVEEYISRLEKIKEFYKRIYQKAQWLYASCEGNQKKYAMEVKKMEAWLRPIYFSSIKIKEPEQIYTSLIEKMASLTHSHAYSRFLSLEKLIFPYNNIE